MQYLFVLIILATAGINAIAQQDFQGPEGKKAAIVLTYDDAMETHLRIALPQLDKAGFKATFFLDGRMTNEELEQWRAVSKSGHELGNHTLYHPCSSSILTNIHPHYATENYDEETILREIGLMNRLLYAIDNQTVRTYAYPCTETSVGGQDYSDKLRNLATYARIGGNENAITTDFENVNPYKVPSWAVPDNTEAEALLDFAKRTLEKGGLGIFMFHGVGGQWLKVSAEAHQELLDFLAAHENEIWVGTFQEVMDVVFEKR